MVMTHQTLGQAFSDLQRAMDDLNSKLLSVVVSNPRLHFKKAEARFNQWQKEAEKARNHKYDRRKTMMTKLLQNLTSKPELLLLIIMITALTTWFAL